VEGYGEYGGHDERTEGVGGGEMRLVTKIEGRDLMFGGGGMIGCLFAVVWNGWMYGCSLASVWNG
jgi:hypothetical protein